VPGKTAKSRAAGWIVPSDLNGFFGLAFDNVAVVSVMAGILVFGFQFPADVIYRKMIPGSALAVLFGDWMYSWMAIKLARRTGNPNTTALPLGLDTPSTIGIALAVLGPAFVAMKQSGLAPEVAAIQTWHLGMATMVLSGVFKLALSFAGPWVQRIVPKAGLLGSLAGVGLALIGFLPLVEVFSIPLIGVIALGLVLYTLTAKIALPKNIPGVLVAVVVGTGLYYALAPAGLIGGTYAAPKPELSFGFPWPTFAFWQGMTPAIKYLPISIPFALITVVGGINNAESAKVAGDTYNTRDILIVEAVSTLIAGFCGGVAQTTPYIGHPAYKRMGCRAGYTFLTGIFIGLGGVLGYIGFMVELIPQAVIAPILVFVGIEITCQAFMACERRHAPAVAITFLPTIASLVTIKLANPKFVAPERFQELLSEPGKTLPELLVTIALGNGFILTAMFWGAILVHLIDRKVKLAALYAALCAVFAWFGLIHSALPSGDLYLPWHLTGSARILSNQFALAYLALAALFVILSASSPDEAPGPCSAAD